MSSDHDKQTLRIVSDERAAVSSPVDKTRLLNHKIMTRHFLPVIPVVDGHKCRVIFEVSRLP